MRYHVEKAKLRFLTTLFLFLSITSQNNLEALSLEEKIGQLLLVHFNGEKLNDDAEKLLQEAHVGGLILYIWSNTLSSPGQVACLATQLQEANQKAGSNLPLFIAVDQEGGRVNRLREGFAYFPSQKERAASSLLFMEALTAEAIALELKSVGINLNFAPVVDVNTCHECKSIGDRAYGSNPQLVAEWGKESLLGYKRGGVLAALKHFPGHGDAMADSHEATPVIEKTREELQACELVPYFLLAREAPMVMTAHLICKEIDPVRPATFSPVILNELLRKKIGFEGVIVSDSLVMKGSGSANYAVLSLQALQAGCDLLCLGGKLLNLNTQDEITPPEVINIHRYLVQAVKKGDLSLSEVDAKVARIMKAKADLNKARESPAPLSPSRLAREWRVFPQIRASLTPQAIEEISKKIYTNECSQKKEKLVWWNEGEPFLSLGIGHFIWYPEKKTSPFDEGFKLYLAFLKQRCVPLPSWLPAYPPWNDRESFLKEMQGEIAEQLRGWFLSTLPLQAEFMVERLFTSLHRILQKATADEFSLLVEAIASLAETPQGIFAMIDYLNFKGEGLSEKEAYGGMRWGLYQALLGVKKEAPLASFQKSASTLLEKRVQAAPLARGERRWLQGWKNRIARYSK
jgi:beta-glucosidase-like glycosyl hydrolase